MNLLSFNIRGSGNRAKQKEIHNFISSEKLYMCLFKVYSESFVHSNWGNKEVKWTYKKETRRSEGMIIMWKPNLFEVFSSLEREDFVEISL